MSRLEQRLKNQRKMQVKRLLWGTFVLLAAVVIAGASYFWFAGGSFEKAKRTVGMMGHKVNILVLGVDQRSDDVGRSDTMFVVTVDTDTKAVSMLSVPRDTRVKIPGHGWDKINHAYAEGGHQLAEQAAEGLLGIPLDYYVIINFAGFNKIVDAAGGVTIDVEKRMHYEDPYDNLVIDLQPGRQHMDGRTAIQYVRYRDEEGDIGRVQRQQKFVKAMLAEITSPTVLAKIPGIIKEVNSVIKTDMSTSEMLNLAKLLNDAAKQGLNTDMVPGKPAFIDDISYWLPDVVVLREQLAQILGLTMDDKYMDAARRLAVEYESSIPKEMKIVELPKSLQSVVKKPVPPEKPKSADKSNNSNSAQSSPLPSPPGKIKVEVVNASGAADAGDKMAAVLRGQGFEVIGVSTVTNPTKNTVVISNTTNNTVVNKLTGLPFQYVLQVIKDDSKASQATVVIGKDYAGK